MLSVSMSPRAETLQTIMWTDCRWTAEMHTERRDSYPTSLHACGDVCWRDLSGRRSFSLLLVVSAKCDGRNCGRVQRSTHKLRYARRYWRIWFHSWFAGAAKVTEEGPAMGVFCGAPWAGCKVCDGAAGNSTPATVGLTRHGMQAQSVLSIARSKDRGVPLMPLGVIIDLYMGYAAGIGPSTNHWNVLPMSAHDQSFDALLHKQLFTPSGLPDGA
eukprot:SAG31_NODE_3954_length_3721_cov_2.949475_4_plen_215_part_00